MIYISQKFYNWSEHHHNNSWDIVAMALGQLSACLQAEFVIPSDEITERIATENSPVNVKE